MNQQIRSIAQLDRIIHEPGADHDCRYRLVSQTSRRKVRGGLTGMPS
jgi:hypothetical protein